MERNSPGEPIGCVALLVGLAALLIVASTTTPGRRLLGSRLPGLGGPPAVAGAAPDPGLAAQREAMATQIEALGDEARRMREERMSARKERMLAIAAGYGEGERRQ